MTFSEFGRTPFANDGQGTDHGSSAPHFVFGAGVKGGFYGQRPSLAGLRRWDRMPTHVDLRDYYGSVIDGWLGGGASDVLPGNRTNLGLFSSGPNPTPGVPARRANSASSSPMAPERLYDSRSGIGGRSTAIGPGETVKVRIAGAGTIPASGVTAVAVNLTSIRPGTKTYLTAFPTGQSRPDSSTLNPRAGAIVPNMTIVGRRQRRHDLGLQPHVERAPDGRRDGLLPVVRRFVVGLGLRQDVAAHAQPDPRHPFGRRGPEGAVFGVRRRSRCRYSEKAASPPPVSTRSCSTCCRCVRRRTGASRRGRPVVGDRTRRACRTERVGTSRTSRCARSAPTARSTSRQARRQVDLVADVVGCFSDSGAQLSPVAPRRLLDTRTGVGAAKARASAPVVR